MPALQPVVADRACGVQAFLDIAGLEDLPRAVRMVRPDAGETIGLQLQPHREGVALRLAHPLAHRVHFLGDPQQGLHVVADLVRDHVGLGEVTGRLDWSRILL